MLRHTVVFANVAVVGVHVTQSLGFLVLYHEDFDKDVVIQRQRGHRGPPVLEGFIFVEQHGHGEVSVLCIESDGSAGKPRNGLTSGH